MKFKTKGVKANGKNICDLKVLFVLAAGVREQEKNGALYTFYLRARPGPCIHHR